MMRLALAIWLCLWARIGFPWRSFQWTPSFRHVQLIPFMEGSVRGQLLNVVAFVPLGIIATRLGWHPRTVIVVGFAVSLLTEFLQLFSTRRYPSTTDLILNTAGVVIGVVIAVAGNKAQGVSAATRSNSCEPRPPNPLR
jgi:glycopeptide antibiotics resistance protein